MNLLEERIASRRVFYDTNETILSSAIRQRQWTNVVARIRQSPAEVSTWVYKSAEKDADDDDGCIWNVLPIHQACERDPPLEVVQLLIEIFPEGVRQFSKGGQLPLHCAIQWAVSPSVIAQLLMAYPDSLNGRDQLRKWRPIDYVNDNPIYEHCDKKKKELILGLLKREKEFWANATWTDVFEILSEEVQSEETKISGKNMAITASKTLKDDTGEGWLEAGLTIIVIGASGDLAKKKTYPSLLSLYVEKFLPKEVIIYGFARSKMTDEDLREQLRPFLLNGSKVSPQDIDDFLSHCFYQFGKSYDDLDAFQDMVKKIEQYEDQGGGLQKVDYNRLFYFAIPPNVFVAAGIAVKKTAMATRGWSRVIVEKPFGRDLQTYEELSAILSSNFREDQLFRIDHYLGKEMTQNLLVLRFSNIWFEQLWNRREINCVIFTFKEPIGTEGRGGYFDQFGIIRDVIQNHLLQVFSLIAMEAPVKCIGSEAGQKIRDAKVQVLHATTPVTVDDVVLGQYEGYTEDPTILNKESNTATYATVCLYVHTPRWEGVPFILKAGKALDERKAEIRIQFKDAPGSSFLFEGACPRNELVIRIQPNEAIYMKTNLKTPGFTTTPVQSEIEVNYDTRFFNSSTERDVNPDAYTRLILDVLRGNQGPFVRDDELKRSWEIFTPVLQKIESENIKPFIYKRGSRGPKESDEFIKIKTNFQRNEAYADSYRNAFSHL